MGSMEKKASNTTKTTVNKLKSAPQKIVAHTLNTAFNAVEKAVETDMKRKTKKVEKTVRKLKKAQIAAKVAQKELKKATKNSSSLKKENNKKSTVEFIKEEITEKLNRFTSKEKNATFYYDYKKLLSLTFVYAVIAIVVYFVSLCLVKYNSFNSWFLFILMVLTQILCLMALVSVLYVTISPQTLALTDKEGIQIDHNELLKWSDIEFAEERYTSFIGRRPIIVLHLKNGRLEKYNLRFMQKLCQTNVFTPFSIPLYAMTKQSADEIKEIIKSRVRYQNNC